MIVRNPATGEALGEVAVTSPAEVDATIERARVAQPGWAATPRHERHRVLLRFSELVAAHAEELARLLALESGKLLGQAAAEIEVTTRLYRGYAERMLAMTDSAQTLDNQPGNESDLLLTRQEPLGVVAAILPFNFPSDVLAHKAGPALATGNAVVAKPSEEDPLTVSRELELFREAGLPAEVLNLVYGGPDVGRTLVADRRVAAVSFTGSTEAGIDIATTVARRLAPAFLELGGNDALIVLDDADLELVVDEAVEGRLAVNGQCCISNKRLIVDTRVHDELLERIAGRVERLRVGDPIEAATEVGPLISVEAASRVETQVAATVAAGALLVGGGSRDGTFFAPTVLSNVTPAMEIARDLEVFGPVLPLIRVHSEDEAVAVANASRYGLSGAVFSRDLGRAVRLATRLETGQVVINGSGQYRADASPFGGYKHSGIGREGLATSLHEYLQTKNIVFRRLL